MSAVRVGIFTRLLDEGAPAERYRLALEQIALAEELGLDTAWVAQHHFNPAEGGLPSPLVFLAHAAAVTRRIRLGTGIVTLPTEHPVRTAEDASVADILSGGRLELGTGSGGTPSTLQAFGVSPDERSAVYEAGIAALGAALRGERLGADQRLYPPASALPERIWEATFSVEGGARIGARGNGLLLSRTQPRADSDPRTSPQIQQEIVDAYLAALPEGAAPRILASRSLVVGDDRERLRAAAVDGLARLMATIGIAVPRDDADAVLTRHDIHVGTAADVLESLHGDPILGQVTDIVFQVHPVEPPQQDTLRSIELIADVVGPELGWKRRAA